MNNLNVLENTNPIDVFTGESMDDFLRKIESEVMSFVPDLSTDKGRKEIASIAHKVSRSKVAIDNAGKTLTADWKNKAKKVDASRKEARDFLDSLRDTVRLPLTEWEEAERLGKEEEALRVELEAAYEEAVRMNILFDREKAIEERERIAAEKEAEELRIKEEARLKAEAIEREKLIIEQTKKEATLKAERDRLQAIRDRLQAIEDARIAQERAVREAQEQARVEAERAEKERLRLEAEAAKKAELLAANETHRASINNKAKNCFVEQGFNAEQAKKLVSIIAKGLISKVSINY